MPWACWSWWGEGVRCDPGKRLRRATLRDFDGTGLVEFASAARRQPGKFSLFEYLPDQDGSGVAFYWSQANMRFLALTLMKCE